jgi:uncharacterized caspase-like protein
MRGPLLNFLDFARLLVLCLALGQAIIGTAAQPQTRNAANNQRIALVIGNDSYTHVSKLANARADARAVAAALKQTGFDVTLRTDLNRNDMMEALRIFITRVAGGSDAVFYFAGHGVEIDRANYLLPVDLNARNPRQVQDDALALQRVLDDLRDQGARFSLAIIDACRDNPLPREGGKRTIGGARGLSAPTPATG